MQGRPVSHEAAVCSDRRTGLERESLPLPSIIGRHKGNSVTMPAGPTGERESPLARCTPESHRPHLTSKPQRGSRTTGLASPRQGIAGKAAPQNLARGPPAAIGVPRGLPVKMCRGRPLWMDKFVD
ncbi:hypothetical protein NDU88_004907 [Pleurodeles waltl]|uniref:Uncharacterized protein n=1 Tax=Pleurodeles waltl TaxID=8319 RepID=A0AAV7TSV1_PLEWA|nr:hypothetical protein NDU88_004907 [Pleurodeles waltl]